MVDDCRKVNMIRPETFKEYIIESLNNKIPIEIKYVVFCPNMDVNIICIRKFLSDVLNNTNEWLILFI